MGRVALKLPSRLCIKFRWSRFHSELGTISFLGEVVKFVQGQGGRESFGQLHSAFVAAAAGTLVKIKLESQL